MRTRWVRLAALTAGMGAVACEGTGRPSTDGTVSMEAMDPALTSFSAEALLSHIEALAHRAPGTAGEERTVRYLEAAFRSMNLAPGNPDGTYIQNVPLVGVTPRVTASLVLNGRTVPLQGVRDYIASSRRVVPEVSVENSEMVFVGYGVVAPEYGWDDYKDVDVTGKTIVMLINDPAVPHPDDPELDPTCSAARP
jgi:hypothetical protein